MTTETLTVIALRRPDPRTAALPRRPDPGQPVARINDFMRDVVDLPTGYELTADDVAYAMEVINAGDLLAGVLEVLRDSRPAGYERTVRGRRILDSLTGGLQAVADRARRRAENC